MPYTAKYNKNVEAFRDDEYPMMKDKIYLDHGGTTIYAKSLINQFSHKMTHNLYGNPHSDSDPAQLSSHAVEEIREAALRFFGADPEHFDLVFTANATAAIKLVGECFSDLASSDSARGTFFYAYHRDSHTSLVGVRALTNGLHHCFASDQDVEDWLEGRHALNKNQQTTELPGLFAYPGQSNMTGRRLPMSWPAALRASQRHSNVYSLLDAAALSTTTQLDFSDPDTAPDFTALSFYKIFGFPDLGALIVRKSSGQILKCRKYFGGGTITMLTVHEDASVQRREVLHEFLEEGTLPFHNIIALGCAMDVHHQLYGSMTAISQHTSFLSQRLYRGLSQIRHNNGRPLCIIYNDGLNHDSHSNSKTQGGTVAFNVVLENGAYVEYSKVETLANNEGIYVRSGGLCNAGGIAHYLQIRPWQWKRNWTAGFRCGAGEGYELIHNQPTGVVRASLGAMSTIADVDTFLDFMLRRFVSRPSSASASEGVGSAASKSTALSHAEEWIAAPVDDSGSTTASPTFDVFESFVKDADIKATTTCAPSSTHQRRLPPRVSSGKANTTYKSKHQVVDYVPSSPTSREQTRHSQEAEDDDFNTNQNYTKLTPSLNPNPSVQNIGNTQHSVRLKTFASQPNLHRRSESREKNHSDGKHRRIHQAQSRLKTWVTDQLKHG